MSKHRITRRAFVASGLLMGAVSSLVSGNVVALARNKSEQKLLKEPNAIAALIEERLPNVKLDQKALNDYAEDLIRRVAEERDNDSALYRSVLKSKLNNNQLEHFIVQDFLMKSDALITAHLKKPVTFLGKMDI